MKMWTVKAALLGIWLFSFGTIAYLYLTIFRSSGGAVAVDLITHFTTHNPVWWIALVACLAVSLFITHSWSGRPILWITLAVTELLPVGLFALFLAMVSRMNDAV